MTAKKAATKNAAAKGSAKTGNPNNPAKAPAKAVTKAKMSALDAAARVLADGGGSMGTAELVEAMAAKKLWQSPNGKTPAATLYAAILREITTKGIDSRFQKTEPGRFAAAGKAGTPPAGGPKPMAPKPKAKGRVKKTGGPASVTAIPSAAPLPVGTPEPAHT